MRKRLLNDSHKYQCMCAWWYDAQHNDAKYKDVPLLTINKNGFARPMKGRWLAIPTNSEMPAITHPTVRRYEENDTIRLIYIICKIKSRSSLSALLYSLSRIYNLPRSYRYISAFTFFNNSNEPWCVCIFLMHDDHIFHTTPGMCQDDIWLVALMAQEMWKYVST